MKAGWQSESIQQLHRLFESTPAVKALLLVGSNAVGAVDSLSDVDLVCVVDDAAIEQFYPSTDWFAASEDIFAIQQPQQAGTFVTRICLNDFRRFDFVFMLESTFEQSERPLYDPAVTQVLFSRSPVVDKVLVTTTVRDTASQFNSQQFEHTTNQFWFKAVIAVNKVMRNDLLIGLHLALDLARDCLMMGMILRDRDLGTTVHRYGGLYNDIVEQLRLSSFSSTPTDILAMLAHVAGVYDRLAARWSPGYQARSQVFLTWITQLQTG